MNSLFDDSPTKRASRSASRPAQVMTVLGPVPVEDMGITLMHEHILLDGARTWKCPCHPDEKAIAEQKVNIEIIGELRMNPYMNRDNVSLDDTDLALSELKRYQALGGHTVVDATNIGIGREPEKLARISRMSGLKIVMGTGFYLEHTHPEWLKAMDVDAVTDIHRRRSRRRRDPAGDPGRADRRDRRQQGFHRRGAEVADAPRRGRRASPACRCRSICPAGSGWRTRCWMSSRRRAPISRHTVLCHMNPSHDDLDYQKSLARRGAFLEYDMIGMDYYYADQDAQSPSDEENARAIRALVAAGFGDRLLLSQDVFLKIMLTRYGGFGYGYILKHFVPRLKRHGLDQADIDRMLVDNPRAVFARPK